MRKDVTYIENGLIIKSESTDVGSVRRQGTYGQAAPWWQRFNLHRGAISNCTGRHKALKYQVFMKFLIDEVSICRRKKAVRNLTSSMIVPEWE